MLNIFYDYIDLEEDGIEIERHTDDGHSYVRVQRVILTGSEADDFRQEVKEYIEAGEFNGHRYNTVIESYWPDDPSEIRTKYIAPDFRPALKDDVVQCAVCRKTVKSGTWEGFILDAGFFVVHPDDVYGDQQGSWQRVGSECVRRIGKEWFRNKQEG